MGLSFFYEVKPELALLQGRQSQKLGREHLLGGSRAGTLRLETDTCGSRPGLRCSVTVVCVENIIKVFNIFLLKKRCCL